MLVILSVLLQSFLTAVNALDGRFPDPQTLWQVPMPLNASDSLYAGLQQIPNVKHTLLYNGSLVGRTYSHHAIVEHFDGRLWNAWSSALNDEDSMGQQVWVSTATKDARGEWLWDPAQVVVGSALLPNQTSIGEQNYTFWCSQNITQRAMQPNAFVEWSGSIYAIIEGADRSCSGSSAVTHGPGRLAVKMSKSGKQLAKPCWLVQNNYTFQDLYQETPLGADLCSKSLIAAMDVLLTRPGTTPFSNSLLINAPVLYGIDGYAQLIELTHAVWNAKGKYWRRHWRDSSSRDSYVSWVEYTSSLTGSDWFPRKFVANGINKIYPTNIPDSNTKSFYGELSDGRTYLVSNLQYHPTTKERQPLCISVASDGVHFDWAGVVRTNASRNIIPDSRHIKRVGFSYPHATLVEDTLYVAYSEDKENIWVTEVPLASLDKMH